MDIRSAVTAAVAFAEEAYGAERVRDPLLEEVEQSSGGGSWSITLSWVDPARGLGVLSSMALAAGPRVYKIFEIDQHSGRVKAMRIRELER